MEKAPADLMKKPPHSVKDGIFSWPVIIDCFSYGIVMGATCLLNVRCDIVFSVQVTNKISFQFVIVVYGYNDGGLGHGCNHSGDGDCQNVFRGRSTVFATLIFEILLYALELKSFDRSLFSLSPGRAFYKDVWANQLLFWSVVLGMASVVLREFFNAFTLFFATKRIFWTLQRTSHLYSRIQQSRLLPKSHRLGMGLSCWHVSCIYRLVRTLEAHPKTIVPKMGTRASGVPHQFISYPLPCFFFFFLFNFTSLLPTLGLASRPVRDNLGSPNSLVEECFSVPVTNFLKFFS